MRTRGKAAALPHGQALGLAGNGIRVNQDELRQGAALDAFDAATAAKHLVTRVPIIHVRMNLLYAAAKSTPNTAGRAGAIGGPRRRILVSMGLTLLARTRTSTWPGMVVGREMSAIAKFDTSPKEVSSNARTAISESSDARRQMHANNSYASHCYCGTTLAAFSAGPTCSRCLSIIWAVSSTVVNWASKPAFIRSLR